LGGYLAAAMEPTKISLIIKEIKLMENIIGSSQISLLKATDVAARLNISRSMAYHLMQTGEIPTVKILRAVRVRSVDLDEYIDRSWSGWKAS
jgi:excisionase family DNA binding protein